MYVCVCAVHYELLSCKRNTLNSLVYVVNI